MADDDVKMIDGVCGKRYGEVLLVRTTEPSPPKTALPLRYSTVRATG